MKLTVSEPIVPRPDEEDEISDPEEDTIAGQMALMRGERVKPSNVVYEDDEDEDEDDDEGDDDDEEEDDARPHDDSDSDSD